MRRRAARSSAQFSLFPFLAVLLCTMGSLIVLLLVLVQQARVEAKEQTAPLATDVNASEVDVAATLKEQQKQRQADQAHLTELEEAETKLLELRDTLKDEIATSRLQLGHVEDHIRRLREKLTKLKTDYQLLTQQYQLDSSGRQQQRVELMQLNQQIADARAELEAAKQAAQTKPRSYSIVPYDGPQGTRRRPIYLECQSDRLVIQPEGHVLLLDDMQTTSPGNPLAAALRATREHLQTTGALRGGEPYPLLLVRPDGAKTYSAARNAMSTWGSEYGYELIDAEMQLEFPPADEQLADVVRRSIDLARQQQAAIAEVRSRHSGYTPRSSGGGGGPLVGGSSRSPGGTYLAPSRNGGFEVRGGSRGNDWLDSHVPRTGEFGTANQRGTEQSPHTSPHGLAPTGSQHQGDGSAQRFASESQGARYPQGAGGGFYPTQQPGTQQAESPANASQANANPLANATAGSPATTAQPAGDQAGNPQPVPSGNYAASRGDASAMLFSNPGDTPSNPQANAAGGDATPVAQSRGSGWALPASARGATPFSRPIRVQVHADKLVVLPDRGDDSRARVVPMTGPMQRSIDAFVGQLWEHMNSWGIAGPQAYWKPILSVDVAPGGEARFAELAALMQQSGVEVERKP